MKISAQRERFATLTVEISRQLKKKRVSEKAILQDFERWRKARRKASRRH